MAARKNVDDIVTEDENIARIEEGLASSARSGEANSHTGFCLSASVVTISQKVSHPKP